MFIFLILYCYSQPNERIFYSLQSLNSRVHVFGGHDTFEYFNDLWTLNLTTGNWTNHNTPLSKRTYTNTWTHGEYFYVWAGKESSIIPDDIWKFNNSWKLVETKPTQPTERYSAIIWENKTTIFIFAGIYLDTQFLFNDLWEYDPELNEWTLISGDSGWNANFINEDIPASRGFGSGWLVKHYLYLYGGSNIKELSDFWRFNIESLIWEKLFENSIENHSLVCHFEVFDIVYMYQGWDRLLYFEQDEWIPYKLKNNCTYHTFREKNKLYTLNNLYEPIEIFDIIYPPNKKPPKFKRSPWFVIVLILGLFMAGLAISVTIICTIIVITTCLYSQFKAFRNKGKFKDEIDMIEIQNGESALAKIKIKPELFKIKFDKIKVLEKIGSGGSNSTIYKAEWDGYIVAFKCFNTTDLCRTNNDFSTFEKEIGILGSLRHPNIILFYGGTVKPPRVGIITEFCQNGDLSQYLEKNKNIPIKKKLEWIKGIVSAMVFLHEKNVIHRDLKPENVLLSEKFIPKIIDFGISTFYEYNSERTKRIGTSCYIAPEVVKDSSYTEKCDVFSFSILFFFLITEEKPFGDTSLYNIEVKIADDPDFRPDATKVNIDSEYQWIITLIKMCWNHDPEERPSFEKILQKFI